MRRSIGGSLLLITGFLACPCHLPLVLPLLLALFGGTAIGSWLAGNTGLIYGLALGYFLAALVLGFRMLSRRTAQTARPSSRDTSCSPSRTRHEPLAAAEGEPR